MTLADSAIGRHDRSNYAISAKLREYADLLEYQGADGFRERAYRAAADTVDSLGRPVADILASGGRDSLIELPGIGKRIAASIAEMLASGRWTQLERLRGDLDPENLFLSIPGIGPALSRRFADELKLETLEELEAALHAEDSPIEGIGPRRRAAITAVLAERLGRSTAREHIKGAPRPTIDLVLQVDAMYREKSAAGELRKIAPKRFNPDRVKWLPVMHARHDNWHFSALYSNTGLAHKLGKTKDWVVIYYEAEGEREGRCTVVTETRGPLRGKRVIRGW
ncbi:MAG: helix-hairpin-helix domain-containing protein [Alphaproteobacteria bacterium]|nr:helix-hairpin-helix domain-containing protein [Alphaproteobacteria bacterium]